MQKFINKKALETSSFSVKTVGPLAYLVHKMSGGGTYLMEIFFGDSFSLKGEIECSSKFEKTSEHIDFEKIEKDRAISKIRLNDKNGYLLFYNSKEFTSHRVVIKKGRTTEFDSHKPSKGDLYAVNLLKPGLYGVKSDLKKLDIKVNVEYPDLASSKKNKFQQNLVLNSKVMKAKKAHAMLPNQGLVVEIDDDFGDMQIDLIKETVPKKGMSIEAQLKAQAKTLVKKKGKKHRMQGKYRWKAK